jgi:hypothetical protein
MRTRLVNAAAVLVAACFLGLATLQASWALGSAWALSGAWGGHTDGLPAGLRIGSVVVAVVAVVSAAVALRCGGILGSGRPSRGVRLGMWAVAVVMALSTLANLASPSHTERTINGPIAFAVTLLCIVLAVAAGRSARLPASAS